MFKFLVSILLALLMYGTARAELSEVKSDSVGSVKKLRERVPGRKVPSYLAFNGSFGTVLKTNEFVMGDYAIPTYTSQSLKFAFVSAGDTWDQIAYGLPYYGIGVYTAQFGRKRDLGNPFSLYLFQGATISQFSSRFALNYELNLGVSSGWVPYDAFTNPLNEAIGSTVNTHVAANIYMKWFVSRRIDLHLGMGVNHFSNGTTHQPNSGINMGAVFFELAYNFNRDEVERRYNPNIIPPLFEPCYEHDIQVVMSSKNCEIDTVGTGLVNKYNDRSYNVYGLSYYLSKVPNYKYKYGVGLDLIYDESSNVKMSRQRNPHDGKYYDVVTLGDFDDRISLGFSVRGEISLPYYSIFANVGYNFIHGNKLDKRFYQIVGVKIYLKDNLFGTFGIRANNFSQAQFLYWSLGYTIKSRKNNYVRH